jgi:hypothetical protein
MLRSQFQILILENNCNTVGCPGRGKPGEKFEEKKKPHATTHEIQI